eukprot:5097761-Prymnesium_polylepis.1
MALKLPLKLPSFPDYDAHVRKDLTTASRWLADRGGLEVGGLLVVLDERVLFFVAKNTAAGKPLVMLELERDWLDEYVRDARESARSKDG